MLLLLLRCGPAYMMFLEVREEMGRHGWRLTYLFSVDNIHDDSTLQHASQTGLDGERGCTISVVVAIRSGELGSHLDICDSDLIP